MNVVTYTEVRKASDSKLFRMLAEAKSYAASQRDDAAQFAKAARLITGEIERRDL